MKCRNNFSFDKKKTESIFDLNKLKDSVFNFSLPVLIHIFGESDTGKTSLALDIIKSNKNKSFIYFDTYYSIMNITMDNVYIIKSNEYEILEYLLNSIEKNTCDYLIIDAFSNLYFKEEKWNDSSYIYFNKAINKIINTAFKKNISIILLNTINGHNKPFNYSNEFKKNIRIEIKTLSCNNDEIRLNILKGKKPLNKIEYIYKKEVEL